MKTSLKLMTLVILMAITFVTLNSSCSKKETLPGLFINTRTVIGEEKKDSITVINSDYFDVSLYSYDNGTFQAKKEILKPESVKDFKMIFFVITEEDGNEIRFNTTTDFLNYMSARGYEMADQTKHEFRIDYTFKKKN